MMQVSKRVPFDDPQVLLGVRILYVASNLIIFALYYYISLKIKAKRGTITGAESIQHVQANLTLQT